MPGKRRQRAGADSPTRLSQRLEGTLVMAGPPPESSLDAVPFMAGLTHEGRNILQRGQAAVERIQWRLRDRAEILALLARVQHALDDLAELFESVQSYTAPLALHPEPNDLAVLWREAWSRVTTTCPQAGAHLSEDAGAVNLHVEVDAAGLRQVFYHLLRSALASSPEPGEIAIVCRPAELHRQPGLEVIIRDQGPALGPEHRERLFEPFTAPRQRRCGLGLALARKIVEGHGGQIAAGPAHEAGAEISITLPRRMP